MNKEELQTLKGILSHMVRNASPIFHNKKRIGYKVPVRDLDRIKTALRHEEERGSSDV